MGSDKKSSLWRYVSVCYKRTSDPNDVGVCSDLWNASKFCLSKRDRTCFAVLEGEMTAGSLDITAWGYLSSLVLLFFHENPFRGRGCHVLGPAHLGSRDAPCFEFYLRESYWGKWTLALFFFRRVSPVHIFLSGYLPSINFTFPLVSYVSSTYLKLRGGFKVYFAFVVTFPSLEAPFCHGWSAWRYGACAAIKLCWESENSC